MSLLGDHPAHVPVDHAALPHHRHVVHRVARGRSRAVADRLRRHRGRGRAFLLHGHGAARLVARGVRPARRRHCRGTDLKVEYTILSD